VDDAGRGPDDAARAAADTADDAARAEAQLEIVSEEAGKGVKSVDEILSNKVLTNERFKFKNFDSPIKGIEAAKSDFYALNPSNVRSYSNGTIAGDLADGRTVNLHASSSLPGVPTVGILDPVTE
jgi:hypothetical protein